MSRVVVEEDRALESTLHVLRAGGRNLLFRVVEGEQPAFEWTEVTKPELRSIVAASLMSEGDLQRAAEQSEATAADEVTEQPAAAPTPRFCAECGVEVTRESARFCTACGKPL